ncbi:response regulator transcription factor, partial [Streptomyces sp. SAS_269]|uniref:response regulator n=1 Tax=Streptomyces sp. SAS_269 TaxID=3412749 RepID=UPI00403CDEBE
MTIRVLLADDQALLRGTFKMLFESTGDMETVGEAANGQEAVELARTRHPDVVLMDIRMPEMDGLDATRLISESEDRAAVKVLILTTFEDDEHVAEALRAGASGFLGKGARPEELVEAVRTVAAG